MATAAVLPSPPVAASPSRTTTASPSSSPPPSRSNPKNKRHAAAADLIRNLDAALSGMTAAATSASEDAARARRNARAAGEVARRYGGGPAGSSDGGRRRGETRRAGGASVDRQHEGPLERKRERRAAARTAAEARQRRERPIPPSPRRTPRGGRAGGFWGGAAGDAAGGGAARAGRAGAIRPPHVETAATAGGNGEAHMYSIESTPLGTTEVLVPAARMDGSLFTVDSANFTEFEDAMEHQLPADDSPPPEQQQPTQATEQMAEEEPPALAEGAPPANGYYTQQDSYYSPQQQHLDQQQQRHYQSDRGQDAEYSHRDQQQFYPTLQRPYPDPSSTRPPQQQPPAPPPAAAPAAANLGVPNPPPERRPAPPRSQPTSTGRIEASHVEDVLALSLELERVRSQLLSSDARLSDASARVVGLEAQNARSGSELAALHSELEGVNERSSAQLDVAREQLGAERLRSEAAEEDATLALELAKEAQLAKEECEMWLGRSLEEIDVWRGRVGGLERQLGEQQLQLIQQHDALLDAEEREPTKSVRFKDDCPPSPVVSEDGGYEEDAVNPMSSAPLPPPPPPVPKWSTPPITEDKKSHSSTASKNDALSPTNANDGMADIDYGVLTGIFSPTATDTPDAGAPSKSDMIASGRARLHRASPSPSKGSGLSPHPRLQASDLLRKSAETRRLLRERLTPGHGGGVAGGGVQRPPGAASSGAPRPSPGGPSDDGPDTFASRQGVACRAVGRTIRESGARLKLDGKWWGGASSSLANSGIFVGGGRGPASSEPMIIEGVAQLESMVKGYCGSVEGTIGEQKERIDELVAFCDHLEKEVMLDREY